METFMLNINAVERTIVQEEALSCQVVGLDGARGFEARHEAWLMTLKPRSTIRYTLPDGTEHQLEVASGILHFGPEACSVLVALA